jgi:hypothetical protein
LIVDSGTIFEPLRGIGLRVIPFATIMEPLRGIGLRVIPVATIMEPLRGNCNFNQQWLLPVRHQLL